MKTLNASQTALIPEGVTVEVESRKVTVTGPRGVLKRDFSHASVDIQIIETKKGKAVQVEQWFANRKQLASIRSIISHIVNLMTGVTKGFRYILRFVYAHFPINANITKGDKCIEIRNFLGEKRVRRIDMLGESVVKRSADVKDQIEIEGIDIDDVSLSAARIHQSCLVKNKDIRKFLDGIYLAKKENIQNDD
eukprot:TRINITY_DN18946_c0_g1_i1.p2 TRINITY_DN18946_c0_g1~~TRINITY_DN18946_c0_g1_i1.p2  ORF type:complete len:212 (+),score=71.05 TRINITY_DN18946_c0_g1_i1:58-636(+)